MVIYVEWLLDRNALHEDKSAYSTENGAEPGIPISIPGSVRAASGQCYHLTFVQERFRPKAR